MRRDDFVIPAYAEDPGPDAVPKECRSCHAPILWVTTHRGKRAPINPDGSAHFATCPQADAWRKGSRGPRAAAP